MKVWIGKPRNWFGPYQLAEKLMFWIPKEKDEQGFPRTADRVHNFGEWLAHGSIEPDAEVGSITTWNRKRHTTWIYKFLLWVDEQKNKIPRQKIAIDTWDTWNMDSTLALIILPMLKQLQRTKHGSPFVDDEDVPEELRSTNAPPKENEWDIDDNHHKRWDWVLDEMSWAFEQYNTDWESEYYSGETDFYFDKIENTEYSEMKHGPNHTFKVDNEGLQKHSDRIDNGLRLFGKYFKNLWD